MYGVGKKSQNFAYILYGCPITQVAQETAAVPKPNPLLDDKPTTRATLSNEHFGTLLDLVEVRSEECLVDNKTAARMTDFVFSVCGNSVLGCLRPWAMGLGKGEGEGRGLQNGVGGLKDGDLAGTIMRAMREQYEVLAEKHFPDGRLYLTYMYFVVKRKPRD